MAPIIHAPSLSPLIYRTVFDIWFSDEVYQHWKRNDDAQWQLRCNGGPGSGKTQFSLLVVQDLRNEFKGKNVAIVSIFIKEPNDTSAPSNFSFTNTFIAEVERQLKCILNHSSQEGLGSCSILSDEGPSKTSISNGNDDEVRQSIISMRASYERAFIIVDDLDILRNYPQEYSRLEEEFDKLRKSRFKILTTSRVPFKPTPLVGYCDIHGTEDKLVEGSDDPINIWWECPTCADDGEDEYYICDTCFLGGHRCKDAGHKNIPLIQRRDRVHLDIGTPPLADFVKYHLECTHGDLGLQSQARLRPEEQRTLPPLSPLGRALKATNQAGREERIAMLTDETGDNITIALLRLEHISLGETIDVVGAESDRLPRNIVASFDTGIDHIMSNQHILRRSLGVKAIQIVGKSKHMAGIPFCDLRERIMEGWCYSDKSCLENLLDSENAMEELLSASNGFLQLRFNRGDDVPYIECYHKDFDVYVAQNYGNSLVSYSLPLAEGRE